MKKGLLILLFLNLTRIMGAIIMRQIHILIVLEAKNSFLKESNLRAIASDNYKDLNTIDIILKFNRNNDTDCQIYKELVAKLK